MRLGEMNWMEVENYLKKDDRLLIVLGANEQHGFLSTSTDVKIPLALADAASQQSGVLVAPPLNFGCSSYFADYPGTISIRVDTLSKNRRRYRPIGLQAGFQTDRYSERTWRKHSCQGSAGGTGE